MSLKKRFSLLPSELMDSSIIKKKEKDPNNNSYQNHRRSFYKYIHQSSPHRLKKKILCTVENLNKQKQNVLENESQIKKTLQLGIIIIFYLYCLYLFILV